jgi:hypothetical protein
VIVQSGPDGGPHFVMTMDQHTAFAAALAEHFGNAEFDAPRPRDLFLYTVAQHDAGWRELDARAPRNPETGMPYHLVETPRDELVITSGASPDFNSQRHPYCGLLSSMHSWGLYNGRYGMSDKVLVEGLQGEDRARAARMLEGEERRQASLKEQLRGDPDTARWVDDAPLMQNYKLLQFFDTLALYFHCAAEGKRAATTFSHVPRNAGDDAEIAVTPEGDGAYGFAPWPFDVEELSLSFEGRELLPAEGVNSLAAAIDAAPEARQTVHLRRR